MLKEKQSQYERAHPTVVNIWNLVCIMWMVNCAQAASCEDQRTCHFGTLRSYQLHVAWLQSQTACNATTCYLVNPSGDGFCQDRPVCKDRHASAILSFGVDTDCDEQRFISRRRALRSVCGYAHNGACCNGCDSGTQPSQCHLADAIPRSTSVMIGIYAGVVSLAVAYLWDPLTTKASDGYDVDKRDTSDLYTNPSYKPPISEDRELLLRASPARARVLL